MLHDLTGYLALYCKYPAVEYLWKMGFGRWLQEREQGGGDYFRRLVNLRAKEPKKLFRGLGKADLRLLRNETLSTAAKYSCLKRAGAARADAASLSFARAADTAMFDVAAFSQRCGVTAAELRKYIEKQRKRSDLGLSAVMREFADYHAQLERLAPNADKLPHDLHEAHAVERARAAFAESRKKREIPHTAAFAAVDEMEVGRDVYPAGGQRRGDRARGRGDAQLRGGLCRPARRTA